jgi:hypothetical protein
VVSVKYCKHLAGIRDVVPSAPGCEECLKLGDPWLHLRVCRACGHVGCCDQSPNRHATKHFRTTKHPIIEAYDPPEGWAGVTSTKCCSIFSERPTPHLGPIPDITETPGGVMRLAGSQQARSSGRARYDCIGAGVRKN